MEPSSQEQPHDEQRDDEPHGHCQETRHAIGRSHGQYRRHNRARARENRCAQRHQRHIDPSIGIDTRLLADEQLQRHQEQQQPPAPCSAGRLMCR